MGLEIKLPDMPDAASDEVKWTYHGLVDRAWYENWREKVFKMFDNVLFFRTCWVYDIRRIRLSDIINIWKYNNGWFDQSSLPNQSKAFKRRMKRNIFHDPKYLKSIKSHRWAMIGLEKVSLLPGHCCTYVIQSRWFRAHWVLSPHIWFPQILLKFIFFRNLMMPCSNIKD